MTTTDRTRSNSIQHGAVLAPERVTKLPGEPRPEFSAQAKADHARVNQGVEHWRTGNIPRHQPKENAS